MLSRTEHSHEKRAVIEFGNMEMERNLLRKEKKKLKEEKKEMKQRNNRPEYVLYEKIMEICKARCC
jgi:hypothetical protein